MGIFGDLLGFAGSWFGAKKTADSNEWAARYNADLQREMAQNGVRWKVADAKAAGLHPLAALGAHTASPSAVAVGTDYGDLGLGRLGQNIERSVQSMMTKGERDQAQESAKMFEADVRDFKRNEMDLTLENMHLQNMKLQRELQGQPGMPGPSGIISGQNGKNAVPAEQIVSGALGIEKAPRAMLRMMVDHKGRIEFILGKDAEEALENDGNAKRRHTIKQWVDRVTFTAKQLADGVIPNPAFRDNMERFKKYVAGEFGVPSSAIYYSKFWGTWVVKPNWVRKLNQGYKR